MSRQIEVTMHYSDLNALSEPLRLVYIQERLISAGIPVVFQGNLWGVSAGQLLHWYDAFDDTVTYNWVGL